ncbi:MAG: 37S ribosomal protein S9, mitochondrial [Thelocarpon superellum]|nr:MAG: 37S ribosomal protein S9, mitochondrial [Thelocarpon superellum]
MATLKTVFGPTRYWLAQSQGGWRYQRGLSMPRLSLRTPPPARCARALSTTTSPPSDIIAAPEIDFNDPKVLSAARAVPASGSYFTAVPHFTDDLISLSALVRKYQTLPVEPPGQVPHVAWKTLPELRQQMKEPVRASKHQKIVGLLRRLNQIHQSVMPAEVTAAMARYKRLSQPDTNVAKPRTVDDHGRARGLGRRKAATARVWLVEGEGEVLVNGRNLQGAFERIHDRESAIWPLKATGRIDKYNVWALVAGGGPTGQAEAMTLGLAKALLVHEPMLKPVLRRAGCITRDPRRVERKKPGKLKARKMPAWVKR